MNENSLKIAKNIANKILDNERKESQKKEPYHITKVYMDGIAYITFVPNEYWKII